MAVWLIIIAIIGICLFTLYYLRPKEPFINYSPQVQFASERGKYAADVVNKGIWINPGINLYGLNDAVKQTDNYLATSKDRDYTSYFMVDPENAYSEQDKKFCKGATYPLDLPKRDPKSSVGCGWWFHPTDKSVGVLGTINGPVFTQGLPAGGTFYWNLETAAMKEDFKKCKMIKSCDLLDTNGIRGECGWCDRLGYGIPIKSTGEEKYPDATDEEACGEDVIPNAGKCPEPEPEEIVTPNGISCGTYGRPSADNSIRLYSSDECTNHFQGNWFPNGECLNPEGGSYSYDCRMLNLPVNVRAPSVTVCTPDRSGRLSRECLIQTILSLGYTKQGSIYKMLYTTNGPTENDKLAIKYLNGAGITIPDAILGEGNIDRQSAANIYMSIFNAINKGKSEAVRQSAKLLCVGTSDFDFCMYDDKSTGPFEVVCAQRAFRSAGCQPAGSDYPSGDNVDALASMTWSQVNKKFTDLRAATGSGNPDTQDDAMKRCLGISFSRPPPQLCADQGMEHLMYSDSGSERLLVTTRYEHYGNVGYMALVGVNRNKNGFRQIDVGTGVIPDTGGRSDNIVMKSRAIINSNQPISGTLDCWTDDGLRVFLNNNMLINAWYDQGPTYHNCTINIPANTPTPFEINWYENKGGATLIMRNVITKLNPAMRLPFSKQSAIIALDFFRGSMNDVHDAVKVQNFGCSIQSRGGRSCVNISNKNYIQILTPIRRKLCKTFTCMVWWDTLPSSVTSFSLCRENNYNNRLIQLIHNNKLTTAEWRLNYYNSVSSARDGVNTVGKWIHYAVEWTPLDYGTTLFVNGKQVATKDDPNIPFPDDILQYIFLGRLPPISGMTGVDINKNRSLDVDQQMNIAWFHIYDYALTEKELQQEMKYWDSDEFAKAAPVPPYIAPRFTNWVF